MAVIQLNQATRVSEAERRVMELRDERNRIDRELVAAEAVWDVERRRETPTSVLPLLTVQQTADRLQMSVNKVWGLIRSGKLQARKSGSNTRITEADLLRFIDSLAGEG